MNSKRKIAFFDIDGTLTSEIDGSIPQSAVSAIRAARANGHLMFLNTGRCFQNVESRFREIGFDGYVCGCGTNIYCDGRDVLYAPCTHEITMQILQIARKTQVDLLFESRREVCFDLTHPLTHPGAVRQLNTFLARNYPMSQDFENPNFFCDKFVIWFRLPKQLAAFRQVSDRYFSCIDRGDTFREFVPHGYSKATGIRYVLDYYGLTIDDAYAFGDSNNDLAMFSYVTNSVAMKNAQPPQLLKQVRYTTDNASRDGIAHALKKLSFLE